MSFASCPVPWKWHFTCNTAIQGFAFYILLSILSFISLNSMFCCDEIRNVESIEFYVSFHWLNCFPNNCFHIHPPKLLTLVPLDWIDAVILRNEIEWSEWQKQGNVICSQEADLVSQKWELPFLDPFLCLWSILLLNHIWNITKIIHLSLLLLLQSNLDSFLHLK